VRLSVPSIDSSRDEQPLAIDWYLLLWCGQQIAIDSCQRQRSAVASVSDVIRGGSTQTCITKICWKMLDFACLKNIKNLKWLAIFVLCYCLSVTVRNVTVIVNVFTARCYASAVLAMALCPSVSPSVTSRSSTKTAKRRITQTTPHDSPGTLVFWSQRYPRNSTVAILYGGAKCRWGGSKSATFDK